MDFRHDLRRHPIRDDARHGPVLDLAEWGALLRNVAPVYSIGSTHRMETMTPIRLRLKELREARGWTQTELAERSGVPQGTISKIESGKTGGIDFDNLEKLADALNVNAAVLIHHEQVKRGR